MGFFYKMVTDKDFRRNELEEGKVVAREHARAVRIEKEEKRQREEDERKARDARAAARKAGHKR